MRFLMYDFSTDGYEGSFGKKMTEEIGTGEV